MQEIQKTYLSEDMIQYFVPIRDEDLRVECVYPKDVLEDEIDGNFKIAIKRLDKYVKNITNK